MSIYKEVVNEVGRLKVVYDEGYESPRDVNDTLGKMVCFHNRYGLGDAHNNKISDFESWDEVCESILKTYGRNNIAVIMPLYLYDHSGLSISTTPYSCRWDSGQIGFIFATKEDVRSNFKVKRVTSKLVERTREILLAEVEEYDSYLKGEVFGFILEDLEGNEIESFWGFIGTDSIKDMKDYIPEEYSELLEEVLK